jgi:polyhydroxyalkanoate synthesis regulator phasin
MAKREEIRAMQDAWRAYLDLALGFTEASRKQATKVARRLMGKGGATADQLQAMTEDLVKTSLANRESLTRLVRLELDRALSRVGLATAEEVADLTSRVRDLEQRLRAAQPAAATAGPAAAGRDGSPRPAAAAKAGATSLVPPEKAAGPAPHVPPAQAAPGKAGPAKAAPAIPAESTVPPAKKVAKKAVAKKAVAKKAVAKKAVAKKAPGTPPAEGTP